MSCSNPSCAQCLVIPQLKFFSGATTDIADEASLADAGIDLQNFVGPTEYPAFRRFRVTGIATRLLGTVAEGGRPVSVVVRKNGSDILSVTYELGETGIKRKALNPPVVFSTNASDLMQIVAVQNGELERANYHLSGTLGLEIFL